MNANVTNDGYAVVTPVNHTSYYCAIRLTYHVDISTSTPPGKLRAVDCFPSASVVLTGMSSEAKITTTQYEHCLYSQMPSELTQLRELFLCGRVFVFLMSQLLKSYVAYAKAYCHPKLTLKAARVLQKLYLTMRNEARDGRSMPITMRQLESLVRLSQVRNSDHTRPPSCATRRSEPS